MNILTRLTALPLRWKLALGLLCIALVFAGVTSFATAQYTQAAQPVLGMMAQSLGRERAMTIGILVGNIRTALTEMAEEPSHLNDYGTLVATDSTPQALATARDSAEARFRTLVENQPQFRSLRFVSPDGALLAWYTADGTPFAADASGEPWYQALRTAGPSGFFAGDLELVPDDAIVFAIPVERGQRLGYITAAIDPNNGTPPLFDVMQPIALQSGSLNLYFIEPNGQIESPFVPSLVENEEINALARELAARRDPALHTYISPLLNRQVQGVVLPIDVLGRVLVVETQTVQLGREDETGQVLAQIGVLALGGFVLIVLIGGFFELTIVRPLHLLTRVASRAAEGRETPEATDLDQDDEIGNLYNSFRRLTTLARQDIQALEVRVAQRTRDIEAVREIGQIISSLRDLDSLLNQVISLLRDRFENIYHAQVFLIDATRQFAVLRASTGEIGAKLIARGHRLAIGSQSVIGRTAADGQPVVALDTSSSPIHRMNELLPETRAELALPLRTREGVIGALDLQSKRVEAFSDADIRLFQGVADQLAIAITNAMLFQESQARLAEIEDLNRRMLGEAWRGYEVARRRALPSRARSVQRYDESWTELQRRAVERRELQERFDTDTVTFAVPVVLRDQVFGAVEWIVPASSYSENTRLLARELAARLAVTADNARLLEQSQRLAERERLVNNIASKLTQQTDVSQILQLAVRELGQALRVPETTIRLATLPEIEAEEEAEEV